MFKKAIAAIVALYVVGTGVMFALILSATRAAEEKQARAIELGELHAKTPSADDAPIAEACKGKLTPGDEKSIAVYVAKMKWAPSLKDDYAHVDRTLMATHEVWRVNLESNFYENAKVEPRPAGAILKDNLNPVDLARHLKWARAGSVDLNDVKYLVVARYESLTLPVVGSDSFSSGSGEYGAKVLAFPSGEVVCEGKGHVRMKERVSASGRDKDTAKMNAGNLVEFVFTKSVVVSPLEELCDVGGTKLCELTKDWVGK